MYTHNMLQLTARAGLAKGSSWPIGPEPLIIGRESGCSIRIPDPVVSRQHCEIKQSGEYIELRDLGSLNPTMVNGQPVNNCRLQLGDEIRIGHVVFLVTGMGKTQLPEETPKLQFSTDTLAEQDSVYLFTREANRGSEVHPQTDDDLTELFQLSRTLSRMTSETDLIKAIAAAIRKHFRPDRAWLLLLHAQKADFAELPMGANGAVAEKDPISRDWMLSAMEKRRGVLAPKRIGEGLTAVIECTMASPMFFGEYEIGVLALHQKAQDRGYQKRDLHFFVALTHIVAPFFKAIERIEELEAENRRLRHADEKMGQIIGSSKSMAGVQRLIQMVAPTMQPVLIQGATGTGKELAASLIHELSERSAGPLTRVNCAAIPQELFESAFFGHERGAFTNALARKTGLLEESNGGTLFLDEIADLNMHHQARILRAVETGQFRRVGGEKDVTADFRVIAATNKDLATEIQNGNFREDLYHRLRAVEIRIPPLSQRRCDIPELARHFLKEASATLKGPARRLTPKAIEYLVNLPWPGNVRELRHMIGVACTLCQGEVIDIDDLRMLSSAHDTDNAPLPLAEVERLHIVKVFDFTDGNIVEAARLLGIARGTLYKKLTQYNLRPDPSRQAQDDAG